VAAQLAASQEGLSSVSKYLKGRSIREYLLCLLPLENTAADCYFKALQKQSEILNLSDVVRKLFWWVLESIVQAQRQENKTD
jgi:hypothetical protein